MQLAQLREKQRKVYELTDDIAYIIAASVVAKDVKITMRALRGEEVSCLDHLTCCRRYDDFAFDRTCKFLHNVVTFSSTIIIGVVVRSFVAKIDVTINKRSPVPVRGSLCRVALVVHDTSGFRQRQYRYRHVRRIKYPKCS